MMASGLSWFGVMAMMLLGGGTGLPLSLPPLPEDPVISRVAPEECLWYFSWSGVAEADLKSKNQTEQLLAEPEVKNFISAMGRDIKKMFEQMNSPEFRGNVKENPKEKIVAQQAPKLLHALVTHPACAFVTKVSVAKQPEVFGGAVVSTGEQTDELKASLEKLEQGLLDKAPAKADAKWHTFPPSKGMPLVEWGFRGKYLVIGVGAGSADEIVKRVSGQSPAWLSNLKKRLPIERVSTVHYLNVKKLLQLAETTVFKGESEAKAILAVLGVGNVQAVANVSGLDGTGYVGKTWVALEGEPNGLLSFFGPEPLTPADIKPIPKDASFGIAARMQPKRLFATFLECLNQIDRHDAEQFAKMILEAETQLGFRIKEDLLETLGDSWCVYNSPSEGGLLFTGLTITVPITNRDRLLKSNEALVKLAQLATAKENLLPRDRDFFRPQSVQIKETQFQKQQIYHLDFGRGFMPFTPAWCVSEKHLILSLSPQNIRAFLSRDPASGSLADVPAVADQFKSPGPVVVSYVDTPSTLKIVYPIVQIIGNEVFGSEFRHMGLRLDGSSLPSLASILRHTEPNVAALTREKDGLQYISRRTFPLDASILWMPQMFPMILYGYRFAGEFDEGPIEIEAAPAQPAPAGVEK